MQYLLLHCAPVVHALPLGRGVTEHRPLPSHARPCIGSDTHAGAPIGSSTPTLMLEHTPRDPFRLHALQVSVQSVLQHTPSAQCPLAQSENVAHASPARVLHFWLASHAWSAAQVSSGEPAARLAHVPLV